MGKTVGVGPTGAATKKEIQKPNVRRDNNNKKRNTNFKNYLPCMLKVKSDGYP